MKGLRVATRRLKDKFFQKSSPIFEIYILAIALIITAGYIFFLKTATKEKVVYVEASIERADWWRTSSLIPAKLLNSLKTGSTDRENRLKIRHLRYFIGETKEWQPNEDHSVGIIQFEVKVDEQKQKLFYKGQELLIGNPLVVEVDKSRLELLITKIQEEPFANEFEHKTVTVKIFERREEALKNFREGIELKDNNDITYGRITKVKKEKSPKAAIDQWGNVFLRRNPVLYDLTLDVDLLVSKEGGGRVISYDGSPIAVGKPFEFNHPLLDSTEVWIIGLQ